MTDPRTILAAAGVSLPEVEEYQEVVRRERKRPAVNGYGAVDLADDYADAALVAVAKELAKWHTVSSRLAESLSDYHREWLEDRDEWDSKPWTPADFIADALARYEEAQHE